MPTPSASPTLLQSLRQAWRTPRRRLLPTFWAGVLVLLTAHVLLAVDVAGRGGLIAPLPAGAELPEPGSTLAYAGRIMAVNMTPVCWLGYLLAFDGILTWMALGRGRPEVSSIRARPHRFLVAWLTSIPVWCFFDAVNFYLMDAWRYHNLPPEFNQRVAGYFVAFAAISPGMFLAAQWFQHLALHRLATPERAKLNAALAWGLSLGVILLIAAAALLVPALQAATAARAAVGLPISALILLGPGLLALLLTRRREPTALVFGLAFIAWALLAGSAVGNLTLWVGLIFLLDPLNDWLGAPSILRDWRQGRWGRTLALMLGGALCGLLWEFWNYWALTKWTYHLPFLGSLERYHYFEMPLLGFMGFLPFAVECWVMLNTIIALLERMGLRLTEPLPDEQAVF